MMPLATGAMRVTKFASSALLRPFVRAISVVEASITTTRPLVPEAGLIVAFRYAGTATLIEPGGARPIASAALTGLRTSLRRIRTEAGGGVVIVTFRELGAAALLGGPLNESFGKVLDLADVEPRLASRELELRLGAAPNAAARAALVEAFLLGQLRSTATDAVVVAAVARIRACGGSIRIGQLAKELAISQDPLEKRFRRAVGATPKQYASILRFRRIMAGRAAGRRLTDLAQELGYFDQSHLIRDFRAFTGQPPERFFAAEDHC